MKLHASLALVLLSTVGLAGPPDNSYFKRQLPVVDRAQLPVFKSVPVVLLVSYVSEGTERDGTRWQSVKIHKVIKNRSKHSFGDSLPVAVVKGRSRGFSAGATAGLYGDSKEFIVYLSRYTPSRDDRWLLVTSEGLGP